MKHSSFLKKSAKLLSPSIVPRQVSTGVLKCLKSDEEQLRTKKALPELRGLPVIGFLKFLIGSSGGRRLHEYVDHWHGKLGPIYRSKVGPVNAVFIKSPHLYRSVFRLEGTTPKHFIPEAWLCYNDIRKCKRGILFMCVYFYSK